MTRTEISIMADLMQDYISAMEVFATRLRFRALDDGPVTEADEELIFNNLCSFNTLATDAADYAEQQADAIARAEEAKDETV